MAAIVTDQFRILNAGNFVDSISNNDNTYYAFLGLSNSNIVGFGRTDNWSTNISGPPSPIDNFQYISHYRDTIICGKRITSSNARRVVRKIQWTQENNYDMYRHDYSTGNLSPNSGSSRLYDTNYYVINSDFRVYICIDNGSSGSNVRGNRSIFEPTSTSSSELEVKDDGYVWKYLFTISPSDIIKFDSIEYIILPNNWETTTDIDIQSVRDDGNYDLNPQQIKKVYIEDAGDGYASLDGKEYDVLGDGYGARVRITSTNGPITEVDVIEGGSGYTYGIVDLGSVDVPYPAKLIPIIPPSKGHGYNIYSELGADRVLLYARFDDSTKDFPSDTKFSQVGLIKNPKDFPGVSTYTGNSFSGLYSIKLDSTYAGTPVSGNIVQQTDSNGKIAKGYVASYSQSTKVLKYYQDRSLFFPNKFDQQDGNNISIASSARSFNNVDTLSFSGEGSPPTAQIQNSFTGSSENGVSLDVYFEGGLANPEINKKTGEIIYISNRPEVERNLRQKEDVKIILEF